MEPASPRVNEAYRLLFQAMSARGIDSLAQAAHTIFQCPVVFLDAHLHISAFRPVQCGVPGWAELTARKSIPMDELAAQLNDASPEGSGHMFYADTGSCAPWPRLLAEVVREGAVCGYVILYLGSLPFQKEEDLFLTGLLLDAIGMQLDTRARGMTAWNLSLNTKLTDLLDPETPPHLMDLSCHVLGSHLGGDYAILATPVGHKAAQRAFANYTATQLHQIYPNTLSLLQGDVIVTLISGLHKGGLTAGDDPVVQELFRYFEERDLISGLSPQYANLEETYLRFRQAFLSARIALKQGRTGFSAFPDIMPLPLFASVLEHEAPETFLMSVLPRIQAYDREHGTEYFASLRAYTLSMHNKDQAAARLSIHRNTLLYRLNRIATLFELPFEEEQVALNLLCSFLLMDAQGLE